MNVHFKQQEVLLLKEYKKRIHRLVGGLIKRLPPNILYEDLLSECQIALIQTWRRWGLRCTSPEFEARARTRMRGAMLDYLRKADFLSRQARRKQSAPDFNGQKITFIAYEALNAEQRQRIDAECATHSEVEDAIDHRRKQEQMESILSQIPERERKLLRGVIAGRKQLEMAEEEGVSEPRICQLVTRAKQRARKLAAA